MKKILIIIIIVLTTISCSKNDDEPVVQGYFPTQIQKTDYGDANRNRTYTISYNSQNNISQITETAVTGESLTKTMNYSNGLLVGMSISSNISSNIITYEYNYNTSQKLSSVIRQDNTDTDTYALTYDESTNSYAVNDAGTITQLFLDDENNFLRYAFSPTSNFMIVADSELNGVFKNVKNQIALQVTFNAIEGINFYFFHRKQINSISYGSENYTVVNTRDSNNNIRTVNFNNSTTSQGIYGYVIIYQNRNL